MSQDGMNVINDFRGENEFLNNGYPSILIVDDEAYRTLEHAFQASKTDDLAVRAKIRDAATPREAKNIGRTATLIPDWDNKRLDVMASLVKQKFTEHLDLKVKLLLTGNKDLIQGNTWKDRFWGQDQSGVGENHLGKILMAVRAQIRAAEGSAFQIVLKLLQDKKLDVMVPSFEFLLSLAKEIDSNSNSDNIMDTLPGFNVPKVRETLRLLT